MKRTRGIEVIPENTEDRLSTLPDSLLCHILSFLDTKHSVQTCVLSKRFVNLWSSLPVLDFDSVNCKRLASFCKLVDKVLTLHDNSVKVKDFQFIHRHKVKPHFLEKVINYAMSHGVLRLQIYVKYNESPGLPESGYSSESLRTFKLRSHGWFGRLEKPFSFPELRTLHLECVSLIHSDIFLGCPCLRDLTLTDCVACNLDALNIDAPHLTKLAISSDIYWRKCKVVVSAPRLASFFCKGYPLLLSTGELPVLEVVDIDVYPFASYTALVNMFQPFHNAKSVTLSLGTIKALSRNPDLLAQECTPFENMKSLKFKASRRVSSLDVPSNVMTYLINRSPLAKISMEFHRCKRCAQNERCKYCWEDEHFQRTPFLE